MCTAKVYNSFQACLTSFYLHLIFQIEDSTFVSLRIKTFFHEDLTCPNGTGPPTSSPFLENILLHLFSFFQRFVVGPCIQFQLCLATADNPCNWLCMVFTPGQTCGFCHQLAGWTTPRGKIKLTHAPNHKWPLFTANIHGVNILLLSKTFVWMFRESNKLE